MVYAIFFFVPALVGAFLYLFMHRSITFTEFFLQNVATAVVAGICAGAVSCQNTADVEFVNSPLANKTRDEVSCRHSYPCNPHDCMCSTDSKGNTTCSTCWDTCYEHSYDVDWNLHSQLSGYDVTIDTIDSQGLNEPPRWTIAQVGDPMTFHHSYDNYIKASPGTLFRRQGLEEKYLNKLPPYPDGIHDYHYGSKIVNLSSLPIGDSWQKKFDRLNATVGSPRQANIVLVVVENKPHDYAYALEQHWIGGKKNDTVVVISVQSNWLIQWVHIMSWTSNELFKVKLRDDINEIGTLDLNKLLPVIQDDVVKYYRRKPMHDFEYLMSTVTPTTTQWIVGLLVVILVTVALSFIFAHPDVDISFSNSHRDRSRRRYY